MKLFTDLETPCWNWNEIETSQLSGEIDLRFLIKDSDYETPVKNTDELFNAYLNILYQIPGLNTDLNAAWNNYLIERQRLQILQTQNSYAKIIAKEPKEININKSERAFIDYLDELDRNYDSYEFVVYGLNKDYKEKWDYDYEIPKELKDNEKMNFFLFEEFIDMAKDWVFFRALILAGKLKEFTEKFIYAEARKFNSVKKVYNILYNRFREMDQIDKLKIIRDDYFNLYKLKFEPKKRADILDQIIALREINNQEIPFDKSNSITLREYFKQIDRVKAKEKNRKDGKKV